MLEVRANLIAALIGMLCVAGCGGGGGGLAGGGGGGGTPTGPNVQALVVDSGPPAVANSNTPAVNTLYTTVTICSPGSTTNCQTIDHIQVDTGSSGLRIINTALGITLPLVQDSNGNVLAECVQFVDGSSWGAIRQADIKIGGETAANQEVHIIGDPTYPIPTACTNQANGKSENTVAAFGANGILGVGPFLEDCGSACTVQGGAAYFTCPASGSTTCADSAMPLNLQITNPVASFTTDNNGVIIQLPSVAAAGASSVSGFLIFGINTQSNNGLGSASVITVDSARGFFTTKYKIGTLSESFIDSGSNAFYFPDTITQCTVNIGFYCPSTTLSLSAILQGTGGNSATVNFSVANADNLFNGNATVAATGNLAGTSTSFGDGTNGTVNGNLVFDWGLPFYFGRNVYTAIEGKNTGSGGVGPYFAF
jgi:Protein of unknown function (DUF3443)